MNDSLVPRKGPCGCTLAKKMAKQLGPLFLTGTIDGISFYKSGNRYLVRMKGGPTRKQVLKSPAFARTREHISEFGACSKAGAFLRRCLKRWLPVCDPLAYQRMTQVMTRIKNYDRVSARGQRRVTLGLQQPEGKALLCAFAFNETIPLERLFTEQPVINGRRQICLNPQALLFPEGATAAAVSAVQLSVDLEARQCHPVAYTERFVLAGHNPVKLRLHSKEPSGHLATTLYFLQVRFYGMENGQLILYNGGSSDSMGCIGVDPVLLTEVPELKGEKLPFRISSRLAARMEQGARCTEPCGVPP